jgi:hypothetical protein
MKRNILGHPTGTDCGNQGDFVIGNGRFYNDHAHPEYFTPECSALDELVAHDRAGERILMACAHRLSEQRGSKVRLYKNNTDFRGHSYGCHDNYLLPRSLPWETLVEGIQAFLVPGRSWRRRPLRGGGPICGTCFSNFAAAFHQRTSKCRHQTAAPSSIHVTSLADQSLSPLSRHYWG